MVSPSSLTLTLPGPGSPAVHGRFGGTPRAADVHGAPVSPAPTRRCPCLGGCPSSQCLVWPRSFPLTALVCKSFQAPKHRFISCCPVRFLVPAPPPAWSPTLVPVFHWGGWQLASTTLMHMQPSKPPKIRATCRPVDKWGGVKGWPAAVHAPQAPPHPRSGMPFCPTDG